MAYYFTIEKKKGIYQPLNISASKYFQTIPKYNKPCAYTLQEIDLFTMMFDDEQELRNALVAESILPTELSTKPLSSRTLIKGEYHKVPHDFLYQKDLEYIMDPTRLIALIMKRYHQDDFVFIKKLADNFANHYECRSTAPEIRQLAEISIREGKRNYHLDEVDQNGDKQVARLIKLLILKHYERPDGKIDYKNEINYRNLHAVIAFINNYDKKHETINYENKESSVKSSTIKEPTSIEINTLGNQNNKTSFATTDYTTPKNDITVKTKTRKKKNYTIEGQIDFTDLI